MPVSNKEITGLLNEIADLLDIRGENQFRVRSYRTAANTIAGLTGNITQMSDDEIKSLPDIGESIAKKIREVSDTGSISQLDKLRSEIPESLIEIMKLEQMGPRRTRVLNEELNIESLEELKKAAEEGKIEKLEGFGKKTIENILKEIKEYYRKGGLERFKLNEAEEIVTPLLEYLGKEIKDIKVAGSYRRRKETVGDIDILGTSNNPGKSMDHFVKYEEVKEITVKGKSKSSVKLRTGLQVDLRIVQKKSFGAALLYFTGSKAHNITLRKAGQGKGYKINEYGIYKDNKFLAGKTEKEMYRKLGLSYIEPELRENNGEIDSARRGQLPDLVDINDIRGDLQAHTNATDGNNSLEEMAKAAKKLGYEYLAVTDHSKKVSVAGGLDEKELAGQIEEINKLNQGIKNFRILKSVEVDILKDGSLDLDDVILKELDLVICAIHSNMNLPEKKQTNRILRAMENPHFNILAHPTGRMIGKRSGYEINMDQIMNKAKERGCFLEINSNPDRLDLSDRYIRQAEETGLKLAISTDAHSTVTLENMKYGVAQARRGWLKKDDVINTRSWKDLEKLLKKS